MQLSIITINLNNFEGLKKTINSVAEQSWTDFEYIVIDGGSTDGSKEFIEKNKDVINYFVSEKDSGIYNAMNKGIKVANGEYILFLNSGDWLYDNNTLLEVNRYIDNIYDIYYGNAIFKFDKKDVVKKFNKEISFNFFIEDNFCHQSTFIRKKLFYDLSFYNEDHKIASDWEFFVYSICKKNISHKHIDIVVSNYDFQGISSKPEFREISLSERKQVFDTHFPMFISDYILIDEIKGKRVQNLLYIKKFRFAWKLLKGFSNILLLFLPKRQKNI